jgi:hypothetical protein
VSRSWLAVILTVALPVFFVALWLAITTLLSALSGWPALMKAFPDKEEAALLRLSGASGAMGLGVNLRGVLTLSVCPSGLRAGMSRFLAPFARDFLVPWDRITVTHKRALFISVVRLQFGQAGNLTISETLAAGLAAAAGDRWPISGRAS